MIVEALHVILRRYRHGFAAVTLAVMVMSFVLAFANWYLTQDARLGVVRFPTSCSWRVQREFIRSTALLHLFQFSDAEDSYRAVIKRDPDCAIAYWGLAMSRLKNPLYELPTAVDQNVARQAISAAASAGSATPRERAYIAAVDQLFNPADASFLVRQLAYANAMGRLVGQYPNDDEAKIFYALALNFTADPAHDSLERRAHAAELLLQVFSEEPDHPGIEHYLTYCLGHRGYQPKPFARVQMATSTQRIVVGAFALIALCSIALFVALTSDFRPGAASSGRIGGPFVLTASDGKPVSDRAFRGRWMLVYFGYTNCPDICPTTLLSISEILKQLGQLANAVQPIFVTIDPERDNPKIMAEYTNSFDPRIIGLTGTRSEIAAIAKEYRVFYKKTSSDIPAHYFMEHSSYIYLMDPKGRYVTLFSHEETDTPEEIASRLRKLINGFGPLQTAPPSASRTAPQPQTN